MTINNHKQTFAHYRHIIWYLFGMEGITANIIHDFLYKPVQSGREALMNRNDRITEGEFPWCEGRPNEIHLLTNYKINTRIWFITDTLVLDDQDEIEKYEMDPKLFHQSIQTKHCTYKSIRFHPDGNSTRLW